MKKILIMTLCAPAVILLNSCLGVSADITIKADGSGKITLEYRVSQALESLGRLDGNENWPAIPVGRGDFERSLARIPGLRLASFSAKSRPNAGGNAAGSQDLVTRVVVRFSDTNALLAFLDSTGSRARLIQENGKNHLRLVLLDPAAGVKNPDLLSFLKEISADYTMSITLNAPGNAVLTTIPSEIPSAKIVPQGKKVSAVIGMGEIFALNDGLTLEMIW